MMHMTNWVLAALYFNCMQVALHPHKMANTRGEIIEGALFTRYRRRGRKSTGVSILVATKA